MSASTNMVGVSSSVITGNDTKARVLFNVEGGAATVSGIISADVAREIAATLILRADHADLLNEGNAV